MVWLWLLFILAPVVVLLIVLGVLGLLFTLRMVRAGTREPAGITTMPWLNTWWDGRKWRSDLPIPASAPRSPDGAYWWDGAAWRPVR